MNKAKYDILRNYFKDARKEINNPFVSSKTRCKTILSLIDTFIEIVRDQWQEDNPQQGTLSNWHEELQKTQQANKEKWLLDRIDALEEKVADLMTPKTRDNTLHLCCQRCGHTDVVLKKHAKDWKCPSCEVMA